MHRNYLKDSDYQANRFTLKAMGLFCILFGVIWILNILNIFIVDSSIMNAGFFGSIGISLCMYAVCLKLTLSNPRTKYFVVFFAFLICIFANVTLTYHATLVTLFPILLAVQYRNKKVIRFAYEIAGIGQIISVYGGYYFGLCNANMLLFTAHKSDFYLQQILNGALMPNNPGMPIELALFVFFVVPQWFILIALSPLLFHISRQIGVRAQNEMLFQRQKKTDFMTGLLNKEHYQEMVQSRYLTAKSIALITWDINDMQKINEVQGHEVGDTLIAMAADSIKPLQGISRKAYRTSGDEFALIIENPEEGIINKMLLKWNSKVDELNSNSPVKLSAAMGYSQGEGKDFEFLMKDARRMMYNFKDTAKMAAIPR